MEISSNNVILCKKRNKSNDYLCYSTLQYMNINEKHECFSTPTHENDSEVLCTETESFNFRFLGEGNDHCIVSIVDTNFVLRIKKVAITSSPLDHKDGQKDDQKDDSDETSSLVTVCSKSTMIKQCSRDLAFLNKIAYSIFGPQLVKPGRLVSLTIPQLEQIKQQMQHHRKEERLHKTINPHGIAVLCPDASSHLKDHNHATFSEKNEYIQGTHAQQSLHFPSCGKTKTCKISRPQDCRNIVGVEPFNNEIVNQIMEDCKLPVNNISKCIANFHFETNHSSKDDEVIPNDEVKGFNILSENDSMSFIDIEKRKKEERAKLHDLILQHSADKIISSAFSTQLESFNKTHLSKILPQNPLLATEYDLERLCSKVSPTVDPKNIDYCSLHRACSTKVKKEDGRNSISLSELISPHAKKCSPFSNGASLSTCQHEGNTLDESAQLKIRNNYDYTRNNINDNHFHKPLSKKRKPSTICVELKPKQGFLENTDSGGNLHLCRFCLKQFIKCTRGTVNERSRYCPLELFSGNISRMTQACRALFASPQNNLKIFKDGAIVEDIQEYEYLSDIIPKVLLHVPYKDACINQMSPNLEEQYHDRLEDIGKICTNDGTSNCFGDSTSDLEIKMTSNASVTLDPISSRPLTSNKFPQSSVSDFNELPNLDETLSVPDLSNDLSCSLISYPIMKDYSCLSCASNTPHHPIPNVSTSVGSVSKDAHATSKISKMCPSVHLSTNQDVKASDNSKYLGIDSGNSSDCEDSDSEILVSFSNNTEYNKVAFQANGKSFESDNSEPLAGMTLPSICKQHTFSTSPMPHDNTALAVQTFVGTNSLQSKLSSDSLFSNTSYEGYCLTEFDLKGVESNSSHPSISSSNITSNVTHPFPAVSHLESNGLPVNSILGMVLRSQQSSLSVSEAHTAFRELASFVGEEQAIELLAKVQGEENVGECVDISQCMREWIYTSAGNCVPNVKDNTSSALKIVSGYDISSCDNLSANPLATFGIVGEVESDSTSCDNFKYSRPNFNKDVSANFTSNECSNILGGLESTSDECCLETTSSPSGKEIDYESHCHSRRYSKTRKCTPTANHTYDQSLTESQICKSIPLMQSSASHSNLVSDVSCQYSESNDTSVSSPSKCTTSNVNDQRNEDKMDQLVYRLQEFLRGLTFKDCSLMLLLFGPYDSEHSVEPTLDSAKQTLNSAEPTLDFAAPVSESARTPLIAVEPTTVFSELKLVSDASALITAESASVCSQHSDCDFDTGHEISRLRMGEGPLEDNKESFLCTNQNMHSNRVATDTRSTEEYSVLLFNEINQIQRQDQEIFSAVLNDSSSTSPPCPALVKNDNGSQFSVLTDEGAYTCQVTVIDLVSKDPSKVSHHHSAVTKLTNIVQDRLQMGLDLPQCCLNSTSAFATKVMNN